MHENNSSLEKRIKEWKDLCLRSGSLTDADIDELEDHLREEITQLSGRGLSEEESFLIALRRMGTLHSLSDEFRKINTHNLWKQLFSETVDPVVRRTQNRDLILAILLSIGAVLMTEIHNSLD